MTKNIVICSDGTANTANKNRGTNVFKLYEAVDLQKSSPEQVAFYDDGVGTEKLKILRIFGGAFGFGLSRNVRQLYTELVRVYVPGDKIFLFGFSRGAFTVRILADWIVTSGILKRDEFDPGELKWQVWRSYRAYRYKYRARRIDHRVFRRIRKMNPLQKDPDSVKDIAREVIDRWERAIEKEKVLQYEREKQRGKSDGEIKKMARSASIVSSHRAQLFMSVVFQLAQRKSKNDNQSKPEEVASTPIHQSTRIQKEDISIHFLGVWDTVSAVGLPTWGKSLLNYVYPFKFPEKKLHSRIKHAYHALSIDDERRTFHPEMWDETSEENNSETERNEIEQVWFAGVHTNVGGGYPKQGMSLVTLYWMMEKAKSKGLEFLRNDWNRYRDARNVKDKLYDSRSGVAFIYRYEPRDIENLCNLSLETKEPKPKIHISVLKRLVQRTDGYAPVNIPMNFVIDGGDSTEKDKALIDSFSQYLEKREPALNEVKNLVEYRKWAHRAFTIVAIALLVFLVALEDGGVALNRLSELDSLGGFWKVFQSSAFKNWILGLLGALVVFYFLGWQARTRMKNRLSKYWKGFEPTSPHSTGLEINEEARVNDIS